MRRDVARQACALPGCSLGLPRVNQDAKVEKVASWLGPIWCDSRAQKEALRDNLYQNVDTDLQAGQSVRPSSEPSRTRHQRGTTPRTHSWGTRTNRERIVFSVKLQAELWNGRCQQRWNRIEKSEFCCSITSRHTYDCDRMTGDKVLRQMRNSWIVQLENWWELEAVQSLCLWTVAYLG